ncbi:MAG: hypothetical protein Aurels2KO_07600 [Aureliella sp.]
MIIDPIEVADIQQAYRLYASLHGLDSSIDAVEQRVSAYLNNQPDSIIDLAILAFQEDRIVAPPDVVVQTWGMSRVYNLCPDGRGHVRHNVNADWFDNGCDMSCVDLDASPAHFWTTSTLSPPPDRDVRQRVEPGLRLSLVSSGGEVTVNHRSLGPLGSISDGVGKRIVELAPRNVLYLPLIDSIYEQTTELSCKLLIAMASSATTTQELADYAANAFYAQRANC